MGGPEIPENLRAFIFQHIDSAEIIEVLILVRAGAARWFSAEELIRELRSSALSVRQRLENLSAMGFIEYDSAGNQFHYNQGSASREKMVDLLISEYRVRRQKVLEVIFSTSKRAKPFADAFIFARPDKKERK